MGLFDPMTNQGLNNPTEFHFMRNSMISGTLKDMISFISIIVPTAIRYTYSPRNVVLIYEVKPSLTDPIDVSWDPSAHLVHARQVPRLLRMIRYTDLRTRIYIYPRRRHVPFGVLLS